MWKQQLFEAALLRQGQILRPYKLLSLPFLSLKRGSPSPAPKETMSTTELNKRKIEIAAAAAEQREKGEEKKKQAGLDTVVL